MGTEDRSVSISVCDPLEKFRAELRAWSSQRGASSHLGALSAEFGAAERKWLLAPCLHVSCCTLEHSGSHALCLGIENRSFPEPSRKNPDPWIPLLY